MTALRAFPIGRPRTRQSSARAAIAPALEGAGAWLAFIAAYGVVCATVLALIWLASRTGTLFQR